MLLFRSTFSNHIFVHVHDLSKDESEVEKEESTKTQAKEAQD